MSITPPPPIGPAGSPGAWAHHDWISQAVAELDAAAPDDYAEAFVSLNGAWFATYPAPYDERLRVHRVAGLAVISGMIQNISGSTFPNTGVAGSVPAGFRPATHQILSTVGANNESVRWDIQTDGAIVLNRTAGIGANQFASFACPYILGTP